MKKELKDIIDGDLYRYGRRFGLFKPLYLRWQITYRKASFYSKRSLPGILYRIKLNLLSEKSGIQIPTAAKIGHGLFLGHTGRIIINPSVVMGDNINIGTGVTIGKTNRGAKAGVPTIGSDVWIGNNAAIVGGIHIGDDVMITPNAYINTDVPPHSIVMGNPATIHSRDNATESYINNRV